MGENWEVLLTNCFFLDKISSFFFFEILYLNKIAMIFSEACSQDSETSDPIILINLYLSIVFKNNNNINKIFAQLKRTFNQIQNNEYGQNEHYIYLY